MNGWSKVKAASQYAGVKERTLRGWFKHGLKVARLPSGTILIKFSDIDSFLEKFQMNGNEIEKIVGETIKELNGKPT